MIEVQKARPSMSGTGTGKCWVSSDRGYRVRAQLLIGLLPRSAIHLTTQRLLLSPFWPDDTALSAICLGLSTPSTSRSTTDCDSHCDSCVTSRAQRAERGIWNTKALQLGSFQVSEILRPHMTRLHGPENVDPMAWMLSWQSCHLTIKV